MTDQITNAINNLGEVITGEKINGNTIKDAIDKISEKYMAPTPIPASGGIFYINVHDGDNDDLVSDATLADVKVVVAAGKYVVLNYTEDGTIHLLSRVKFDGDEQSQFCEFTSVHYEGSELCVYRYTLGSEGNTDWDVSVIPIDIA